MSILKKCPLMNSAGGGPRSCPVVPTRLCTRRYNTGLIRNLASIWTTSLMAMPCTNLVLNILSSLTFCSSERMGSWNLSPCLRNSTKKLEKLHLLPTTNQKPAREIRKVPLKGSSHGQISQRVDRPATIIVFTVNNC